MNNYYGRTWADNARPSEILPGTLVNAFLQRVFLIMAAGLAITGLTAYWFFSMTFTEVEGQLFVNESMGWLLQGPMRWVIMLSPLAFILVISFGINRMAYTTASLVFGAFAFVMGISFSFILAAYTTTSVATTFFITAGTFAAMAFYGLTTKADLSKLGSMLMMALFGIIIASVVNWFVGSSTLSFAISILGVLVFTGLTAYDVQNILRTSLTMDADSEMAKKAAILGALTLYLDFINLFLYLLRLLGARRD
ncbi:MAG: Bax inhibitor-1/YccA family protein [Bacteroidia bacterium]|nr:Bax inhibitor-1/YccA family protein [Bacteroidia bacterium]